MRDTGTQGGLLAAKGPKDMITVKVCVGTNCCFSGGERLLETLENEEIIRANCTIEPARCIDKACRGGTASPVVEIDGKVFLSALPERILEEIISMTGSANA